MPMKAFVNLRPIASFPALSLAALLLVVTLIAACDSDSEPEFIMVTVVGDQLRILQPLTITTAAGKDVELRAELAETPEERAQGLMGRTQLAPDSGMLFVIEPPGRGFWMRGTTLALTVAFVGECGEIVDFADLEPLSEEIKNTDRPYAFALEMERGWFTANGVVAGDTLQLPARLRPQTC
jgi:uncharacterized protein